MQTSVDDARIRLGAVTNEALFYWCAHERPDKAPDPGKKAFELKAIYEKSFNIEDLDEWVRDEILKVCERSRIG